MADAIENHLCNRTSAVVVLIARFVINRVRKAVEGLRPRRRAAFESERRRSRIGTRGDGDLGIDLQRLVGRDRPDEHWRGRRWETRVDDRG